MVSNHRLLCTSIVLLSMICKSSAIYCYYCNSANNSACTDLNLLDEESRIRLIPIVHCETAVLPTTSAMNFFCRKIVQTVFHRNHESEVRVTRGCGWVRSHRECYRADNADHLETVCQCFSDHCNTGSQVDPSTATALFLLLAAVLYFVR